MEDLATPVSSHLYEKTRQQLLVSANWEQRLWDQDSRCARLVSTLQGWPWTRITLEIRSVGRHGVR